VLWRRTPPLERQPSRTRAVDGCTERLRWAADHNQTRHYCWVSMRRSRRWLVGVTLAKAAGTAAAHEKTEFGLPNPTRYGVRP